MKRVIGAYASLARELLGISNDASFLSTPAPLWVLIAICGVVGLLRNALTVALGTPFGVHGFQPDTLSLTIVVPIYLCLFGAAVLHWGLRRLGYPVLDADSVFALAFSLQIVHLLIPFVDAIGASLGLPAYYVIGPRGIATEWYTNILVLSPGSLVAWSLGSYAVARVLVRRFQIRWLALNPIFFVVLVSLWIPAYFVYPTFNTLFNRFFGPYLWDPLQYMFISESWSPLWGQVVFSVIAAALGLLHYVRHSQDDRIRDLLQIRTPGAAHVWLLALGSVRYLLDLIWSPGIRAFAWPFVWLNYVIYGYMIYLFVPGLAVFLLRRVFGTPANSAPILRGSLYIWLVYPMVPLISMMTRSPSLQTIEWFRYIPTFMVDNNFLPTGMIAVIPILVGFFARQLVRHAGANWPESLASVFLGLLIIYVLFYQYADRLLFFLTDNYGPAVGTGAYTLCFLAPLFPTAHGFHEAFGRQRIVLPQIVWGAAIINVVLMAVGLISWLAAQ